MRKPLITIGKNITLFPKILPGVGFRELIWMGAAALQAVLITFSSSSSAWPLGLRLTLALAIAIPLMVIAVVPFRGLTFERWLWQQLTGALEPKLYRHATATPEHARGVDDGAGEDNTDGHAGTEDDVLPHSGARGLTAGGALAWDAPNLGVVMAAFLALLMLSSVLAYATRAAASTAALLPAQP